MDASTLVESFADFAKQKNIDRPTMIRILEDVFRNMIRKKYEHDENFVSYLEADVLEETGLEQGAYGVAAAGVVDGVADADRKVVEDRTRRDAFESLDTDVVDDE